MAEFPRNTMAEHAFAEHEHRELAPGIDRLHDVARVVGSIATPDLSIAVLDVIDWIKRVLEPHAAWEDAELYPQINRRAGTQWATKLMAFEHHQIREIARKLEADHRLLRPGFDHDQAVELRGHLFALEALIRAHIEREERFLIPLLEGETARRPLSRAASGPPMRGRSP